jgi:hypothetical protein
MDETPSICPLCLESDVFRHVTVSGAVQFKGHGWSPTGYSKFTAYEKLKAQGKGVTIYENKEEHDRITKGEAMAVEEKKLKKLDRISKKTLGADSGVTQKEADVKIEKAGKDAV